MLNWIRSQRIIGLIFISIGPLMVGVSLSTAASTPIASTLAETRTLHYTHSQTRFVTAHVRGRVLRHYDHVLIVYVPRTVFHTHGSPSRRVVVPAHRVKIREAQPFFGVTSAVVGISPLPVTVTVPVTMTVPGPTTTVTGPTTTITLPQATTTVTVPTTITLPLSGE